MFGKKKNTRFKAVRKASAKNIVSRGRKFVRSQQEKRAERKAENAQYLQDP